MSLSVRARLAASDVVPSSATASTGRPRRPRSRPVTVASAAAADRSVSLVAEADPGEWNRLADQPGGSVFHRWEWLSWVAPLLLSAKFVPLVVLQGGVPVGIAPMLVRRQWGLASANVVPFPYLGPVVPAELVSATTSEVLRWARRHGVMSLELCLHPGMPVVDGSLADAGLSEERVDTYLIDLGGCDEAELFARLGGDARTAIRRSVKRGVTVRASTEDDLRKVLPAVHDESRGECSRYSSAIGEAVAQGTMPVPARCATAVVDGRPVGVSITVACETGAVGWLGATYRAEQHTQAHAALVWDAIVWAASEGQQVLDMCGAPDPGIAVYKQKFRPRTEQHLVGRWQSPGLTHLHRFRHRLER